MISVSNWMLMIRIMTCDDITSRYENMDCSYFKSKNRLEILSTNSCQYRVCDDNSRSEFREPHSVICTHCSRDSAAATSWLKPFVWNRKFHELIILIIVAEFHMTFWTPDLLQCFLFFHFLQRRLPPIRSSQAWAVTRVVQLENVYCR